MRNMSWRLAAMVMALDGCVEAKSAGDDTTGIGADSAGLGSQPTWIDLSTFIAHSCAIAADGMIACWGDDEFGETDAPKGNYVEVASGRYHSCAITRTGSAVCWGEETTDTRYITGAAVAPAGTFHGISAGWGMSCALTMDDHIACWGLRPNNQDPPLGTYVQVGLGSDTGCAISAEGRVACWGYPDLVVGAPTDSGYVEVECGSAQCTALRADGGAYTWYTWGGYAFGGTDAPGGYSFATVAEGNELTCAVTVDGGASICWGSYDYYADLPWTFEPPPGDRWGTYAVGTSFWGGLTVNGEIVYPGDGGQYTDVPDPP